MDANNSPILVPSELQLTRGGLVKKMLKAFSTPSKICYNGESFNLTEAYDTFWRKLYKNPIWLGKKSSKLPTLSLGEDTLSTLAKIIKRGWRDERYLPTRICKPFLEACCFKKEDCEQLLTDIAIEMFLNFINEDEKKFLKKRLAMNEFGVDEVCLNIFKKYRISAELSPDSGLKEACVRGQHSVMGSVQEILTVVSSWNQELEGMMDPETFNFLMEYAEKWESQKMLSLDYDDISSEDEKYLPHKLWRTFFQGWSDEEINFYFDVLQNKEFTCGKCGLKEKRSKHIIGNDGTGCWTASNTERRDKILILIEEQLNFSIERSSPFFSLPNDWKVMKKLESKFVTYTMPEELGVTDVEKKPNIMVYSKKLKKVVMIAVTVMWEEWKNLPPDQRIYQTQTRIFKKTVEELKNNGFEVHFKDIEIGCRGVLCKDLYRLFSETFSMSQGDISKTMEKISKEIILIPKENNDIARRQNLKRKAESETL